MKQLLIKEYKLGINKFFIYSPILFAALLFIPDWVYSIAFMYFFWLTIPAVFSEYNAQNDFTFTQLLPVSKKDIVASKVISISIIQLLHVVPGILVALLSNWFFGKSRMFLDLNLSFFANIMIMYAIFNVLFFPKYFKTAFFFGKAAVLGSFVAILYMLVIEVLNIGFPIINQVFESEDYLIVQVLMFVGSIVLFFLSLLFSIRRSTKHFENRQ